jgi:DnaK suppressor protein
MAKNKKLSKDAQKTVAIMKARKKPAPPVKKALERPKRLKPERPKPEPAKGPLKKSFSHQELDHFKVIILEKKKEILEELEALRDTMVDSTTGEYVSENSTYSTHMEQGTDTMEREKMYLFASREGKFLNYLDDALKRIEKGVYGRCTVCGKLIEKERLEAVPHAQQCLDCKLHRPK